LPDLVSIYRVLKEESEIRIQFKIIFRIKRIAFKNVFSSIGLLSDALRFVLDVVLLVSSTDPNLEIVPLSTNRCGICPDASQELEKREADNENLLLSSNTAEYFLIN
jgi:hypothetical protein